jgi:putative heme iron utilization protein
LDKGRKPIVNESGKAVLLETSSDAIALAKSLIREAQHGALATLDPESGRPVATRVGLATDTDGAPLILVSALAAHTPALRADPRCSLLIGEPGKGDPLAHPRVTLHCDAREIGRGSPEETNTAARYLAHNPKAALYAGLGDFRYFRLETLEASLNAGFGRAYALTAADVLD